MSLVIKYKLFTFILGLILISSWALGSSRIDPCHELFNSSHFSEKPIFSVSPEKLAFEIATRRQRVHEFQFIRKEAQKRGIRVWLFGGTAASYSHYVKWDILRELGDHRLQPDRFDYDYTNIYRSTQDLDIVINGTTKEAEDFEQWIQSQFPYFLGSKSAAWEVRSLIEAREDKGGLLGDFGFMNQHTDSNSTGMVEITDPPPGESLIRDLRDWHSKGTSKFLKDVSEGRITYFFSNKHSITPRARTGKNPPIFSIIRFLTKAFQYNLKIDNNDLEIIRKVIDQFNPAQDLAHPEAARWIQKNGKKLFLHAVDLEYAWNTLEILGLRKKLIQLENNPKTMESLAWWMSKEPLRRKPVGEGTGKTAESLGIFLVSHETSDFYAYENITRSHTGEPNVFISRANTPGEAATYGEGFYTATGKTGARGTGITIRFQVDPRAKEGTDFIVGLLENRNIIILKNKSALKIIPENINLSPVEYFKFLQHGYQFSSDDQAILWKLKRKLDHFILSGRLSIEDTLEIRALVLKELKHNSYNWQLVTQEWIKLEVLRQKRSPQEAQIVIDLLKTRADPLSLWAELRNLSQGTDLETFIFDEWLPLLLHKMKFDFGDRVLESCIVSKNPLLQGLAIEFLLKQEKDALSPFLRAIFEIMENSQNIPKWINSDHSTSENLESKAAYLALHPEWRSVISHRNRPQLDRALEKISNISLYEKLAKSPLPDEIRKESFQFKSFQFPEDGKLVRLGNIENDILRTTSENFHTALLTNDFEIQLTEVTQYQWALIMGENPSHFKTDGKEIEIDRIPTLMNPNRPIDGVSWLDVQIFLKKINKLDPNYHYRLPTEVEWEFAARANTKTIYSFGDINRSKT